MSSKYETPEKMGSFFNQRVDEYEEVMKKGITGFDKLYSSVGMQIAETNEAIRILDLGCGTGLELEYILNRAPNAEITAIDMAKNMLDLLLYNYKDHAGQISVVEGSYITEKFGENYDYIVSVMTMHHLLHKDKAKLYEKIRKALKDGGTYIEGDYVVCKNEEEQFLREYEEQIKLFKLHEDEVYHIDIPFTVETQKGILENAGFKNFKLIWQEDAAAVYTVKRKKQFLSKKLLKFNEKL